MNKLALLVTSLFVSISISAQWVKPAAPASIPLAVGEECYLYNKDADGFLLGANDYGTRASISSTSGHKVYIENGSADGSYYITNFVLQGGMKDQIGYMFMDNWDAIYVDNTKDGKKNNQYSFEVQSDGTYKIGLSEQNADYNPNNYADAYLGIIPAKEDTRIYVCDPENSAGYVMDDCKVIWYFVTPAAYAAYTEAMKQYIAATALGLSIEEAESLTGVDSEALTMAKTVYGNTASTVEMLEKQKKSLDFAIKSAKYNIASVENPVEVLSLLGIATDFTDGTCPGWNSTTGASNKQASNGNNAKDYSVTGNHYENWNFDSFSPGKITATATEIPVGVYRLNALAFANVTGDTYLYVGENLKKVLATQIDIDQPMELYAVAIDGTLEIGLDVQAKSPNWVGLDNVALYYLGNTEKAYSLLVEETLGAEPDYEALLSEGEKYCQNSVYETYQSAKESLKSAATAEKVAEALSAFSVASKAMAESVAAYDVFFAKFNEANEWLGTTTSESDEVNILSDYLNDEDRSEGLYNGNGGALYILNNGLLDKTQILAEADYLGKVLLDAKANAKVDGDDCTDLLKNPMFAETGGWSGVTNTSVTWPEGNTELYPVMQANNVACNIYQELTGMQNGLYELTLQAAFRPGGDYSAENEAIASAYAYLNTFETKIPSGHIEEVVTLNEPADASVAFSEGRFPVTVYGLVTDGTLKVGVTNKVRTVENCRLWAGGVKLTFRAKNAEVLADVIAQTTPVAQALLNNYAGKPELDALSAKMGEAETAVDAYKSLVALKGAMEAVEAGTALYADFSVALKNLAEAIDGATTADAMTINSAKSALQKAQAAYDGQTYNNEEVEQAISDLNAASVAVKMGGESATEENPADYTSAIVNNNFDPARGDKSTSTIEGWTTTTLNGYKENTASYNKNTFSLSQKLTGLPKGKYKVTVHSYYRAGSFEEEAANINNGVDTHLARFYAETSAKTYEKGLMNLSEGGVSSVDEAPAGVNTTTINGVVVPNGTSASVAFYNAGYYLNELEFYVGEDGIATIGLRLDKTIGSNDYVVVGEWKLYYYGSGNSLEEGDTTGISQTEKTEATPVAYYSLSGTQLPALQKGLNLVKMSDGTTVKIFVK